MTVVNVGAVGELDAGVRACKLPSTGNPWDGGAFIEQVNRAEKLDPLFHDQSNSQNFAFIVIGDELSG